MKANFWFDGKSAVNIILAVALVAGACSAGTSISAGDDGNLTGTDCGPDPAAGTVNNENFRVDGRKDVFIPVRGERYAFHEYNVTPFDTVWFEEYFVVGRDTVFYEEFYHPNYKYAYQEYNLSPNDTIWFDDYFVVGSDTIVYDQLYRKDPEFISAIGFYFGIPYFSFFIPVYPFGSIEQLIEDYKQLGEEFKIYNYQYYMPDPPAIGVSRTLPEDPDRHRRRFIRLSVLSAALIALSALP